MVNEQTKKYVRVGLPLRLASAITIHKSQGLSLPEGAVIDLHVTNNRRNPVTLPGLAFVAWTRVTKWRRIAFRNLPSFETFLLARRTNDSKLRMDFEASADAAHDRYMEAHGIDAAEELRRRGGERSAP